MIFKKFKPFIGAKRFVFKDPDTSHEFTGKSIQDLVTQVTGYRSANDLEPLEFLPQTIENYICQLPEHAGSCTALKEPHRSVIMWVQGGVALLKNIAYKSFCSQEEADRRSEVCYKCPKNQIPDTSKAFQTWANDMADRSVGKRRSKYHDHLGVCAICSCPMRSKVWTEGKIKITPVELMQMKAINCWQPEFVK